MARRPRLDRELERYLVDGETVIVAVRLHWFHLAREILIALAATVLAFWVDVKISLSPGGQLLHNASLLFFWGAAGWLLWRVLNWRRDWFVATDKRFLLFYGFIRRRVAMMPLLKVTDMTYDRSLLGRVVGYGKFMLESAGQDQALSTIDHVPDADTHYRAICTQLFGPGSMLRFAPGGMPAARSRRATTTARAAAVAVARRTGRMPVARPPRARAASPARPTGATCRARSAPPSRGTAARTSAARCTWATPARSPSCGCRATTRTRRSTRRRTGPNAADRTRIPRVPPPRRCGAALH